MINFKKRWLSITLLSTLFVCNANSLDYDMGDYWYKIANIRRDYYQQHNQQSLTAPDTLMSKITDGNVYDLMVNLDKLNLSKQQFESLLASNTNADNSNTRQIKQCWKFKEDEENDGYYGDAEFEFNTSSLNQAAASNTYMDVDIFREMESPANLFVALPD